MATLINGISISWSQITLSMLGAPITGVRAISWSSKQEKTNNYGAGSKPVSRGYGRVEYEGSITFLAEEFKNLIASAPDGDVLKYPFFDINILFVDPTNGLLMKCVWKAAEFLENNFDASEGDTMIEIEVPFIMADIQLTTV
jgi:hypothetical protein